MAGFGTFMLLIAGVMFWLAISIDRPRRDGRVKVQESPVIYGISPRTAAVLVAVVGVLYIVLSGPSL